MSHMTVEGLRAMIENAEASSTLYRAQDNRPKPRKSNGPRPATENQIRFLRDLVASRMPDTDEAYVASVIAQGFDRVSQAIDRLKAMPKAETAHTGGERVNRYPGRCERCGTTVEAEEGLLAKSDDGTWEVWHREGECPVTEFPFPNGRYAVETEEGHLAFYVVTDRGLFVQSSDELHRVNRNAQATIIAKIAVDPYEAALRYGRTIGQCGVCGRTLTDEDSRALGIGPVCRQRWAG